MTARSDLLVVGAGAKAAAIAAKVHALNGLGHRITLTIIEANQPAASWMGLNGMTSGDEPLAITPVKDVGFPYESVLTFDGDDRLGEQLDRALLGFSWQQYLVQRGGLARWVNAGSPPIRHRDYGGYLAWVLTNATDGVTIVRGRVKRIEPAEHAQQHWVVEVSGPAGPECHEGRALLLTGPGVHRHLPHDPAAGPRMFHCDSKRGELAHIPLDGGAEIAIVGGGESALSAVAFLRTFRPAARLTVHTPTLPLSRGESFLENRVFSNPDTVAWTTLDLETRRLFVNQCDRGVFGPDGLQALAYDDRCRFVTGRVLHIGAEADGGGIRLDYATPGGPCTDRYDFVVNCTGFDLLEQLRGLFPPAVRTAIERQVGPVWDRPREVELPIGRALELAGLRPRLHIPGLAGIAQGPGFANLGCLGLISDRVLQPIVVGEAPGGAGHRPAPARPAAPLRGDVRRRSGEVVEPHRERDRDRQRAG